MKKDILKDDYFIFCVKKKIKEIKEERFNRPVPKPGYYYRRNALDRMYDKRIVNHEFFINEFEKIIHKKSTLPSNERAIIGYICNMALIEAGSKMNETQENK